MNYGEIRDASLQLIGQYTIAGTIYAPSYNNQQDYLNKIPFLINDCLIYMATTVRRYPAQVTLGPNDGEEYGNWRRYVLPEDLLSYDEVQSALMLAESDLWEMDHKDILSVTFLIPGQLYLAEVLNQFRCAVM